MRIITIIALSLFAIPLNAQSLSQYTEQLSLFDRDTTSELARYVNAEVRPAATAAEALEAYIYQNSDEQSGEQIKPSVQGYRVGVFFDNSPSARRKAQEVMTLCDSLFADIPATMSYANPYFKVSAGYCVTQEEAVTTLHRVQRHFPAAYLMREVITPENIIIPKEVEEATTTEP